VALLLVPPLSRPTTTHRSAVPIVVPRFDAVPIPGCYRHGGP
jgi:hypothetical protein